MTGTLRIERHAPLMEITLDRPEKLNAISDEMLEALKGAVAEFAAQRAMRVLLISATGRYFCAGAELSPDISPDVAGSTLDGRTWYRNKWHSLFDAMEAVEKPIVAAHQGPCLGGGLEMSLSCDFRLAAEDAAYALPEINIGALPGSGGVSRLTRLVGPHWARLLVMTGESVGAQEAMAMGLVHRIYPSESLAAEARAFCLRLAGKSYEALGMAKLAIELAADLDRAQARNIERITNSMLFTGDEHRQLVAQYMQRQAARKKT
ncbi:Enoyl-CoA hydratase/carnithine racemase [Variovorax sp. HW608]|uniref:enoyl-CoA hydratase/isomerase family protein n=1 Tax=Variovorax sp. HW608 TaxID=1034889 RepID=UPI00081FCFED|nr:enoyl-CoA hydratase/isomerase family protein [Variovorax sp. HW608]SCK10461.1 Enoyl-CoA hydratase/carnithine racemase [Variovorax sp. HW608]